MSDHPFDKMAEAIFRAAKNEDRQGELLACLFDGGSATVDHITGRLVLVTAEQVSAMIPGSSDD